MTAVAARDSEIVRWFAERHCCGDLLRARRLVAGWTIVDARRWWRVFGDEAAKAGER